MHIVSPFPKATYELNARVYKILASPIRLEVLNIIRNRAVPVDTLAKAVGISRANMSQHLALLRHAELVQVRRAGLRVYYRIADPRLVELCRILHGMRAASKKAPAKRRILS